MNETNKQKICVILGAGASHDVAGPASDSREDEAWKPPLAKDLFDLVNRKEFAETLHAYSGADALAQSIAPAVADAVAKRKPSPLESLMRQFATSTVSSERRQFLEVPMYIRDVIAQCTKGYVSSPGTYQQLVRYLLNTAPHRVLFLTLNYDTLLERALIRTRPGEFQFERMDDYCHGDRPAWPVKLHGSIDWFHKLGANVGSKKWYHFLDEIPIEKIRNRPITIDTRLLLTDSTGHKSWQYPAVTAPIAGKQGADMASPDAHLEAAREFLADCKKFLVIGTSGSDDDLFELLNQSIRMGQELAVRVIGEGAEQTWSRYCAKVAGFEKPKRFVSGDLTTTARFSDYINSDDFRAFAKFQTSRS